MDDGQMSAEGRRNVIASIDHRIAELKKLK